MSNIRAGELVNFFAAPAPDFFFKRSRLRILFFSQAAPAPGIFFRAASAPAPRGQKTDSGFLLLGKIGKIFFSPQTSKVKL